MDKKRRQLAAIMFTDIVGYTQMMGDNEAEAGRMRARHREVFNGTTEKYKGEVLQYYGDGTLSIFTSALEAVKCALEIQQKLQKAPIVPLRIGLHTGDIVHTKEDIYGDGVNIASRIESACIPGGVFISGKVYDDIKNHKGLHVQALGGFKLKNVNEEMKIYALSNEGLVVPDENFLSTLAIGGGKAIPVGKETPDMIAQQSPLRRVPLIYLAVVLAMVLGISGLWYGMSGSKKAFPEALLNASVAVLPFANMSAGEENEYFSDGITEDILTLISKIEGIKVISRTSVIQYKNTTKTIPQIQEELQVSHILEGSVRRQGNKVRIVAQLIEAKTDKHIWAETYDHEMEEIFMVQSRVAEDIATALEHELSPATKQRLESSPTQNISAYELYLRGREYYFRYAEKENKFAIQLFKEAIALDSAYALAWAGLGDAFAQHGERYQRVDAYLDSAIWASNKAITLDPGLSEGYKSLGLTYNYLGDIKGALEQYQKAIDFNPNNEMAIANMGSINISSGNLLEGIKLLKKSLELNPLSFNSMVEIAQGYYKIGMENEAFYWIEKSVKLNPEDLRGWHIKGKFHVADKDFDKAKQCAKSISAIAPKGLMISLLLGDILGNEKKYLEAEKHFLFADSILVFQERPQKALMAKSALVLIYSHTGRNEKARSLAKEMLPKLLQFSKEETTNLKAEIEEQLSYMYVALGENENAIDHLEIAVEYGWRNNYWADINPFFSELKKEHRFMKLIQSLDAESTLIRAELREDVAER